MAARHTGDIESHARWPSGSRCRPTLTRNEYRTTLIAIFFASLAIFTTLAYVSTTPRPGEQFFQLYVLGSNRKLEHYYPNDNPDIAVNSTAQWFVGLTNSMGSVQYVIIKFRLGNESIAPPNETSATPSPAPLLFQQSQVLLDNETWEFPLNWTITNVNGPPSATWLTLNVNGTMVPMPESRSLGGRNFRIIIELWVYNPDTGLFEFGWVTGGGQRKAAWLQIWFNATMPAPTT